MNAQAMNVAIPYQQLRAFCERHHIRKLALFGSVLRRDFRPDSDVDVLVEFEPEYVPGFFRFVEMQDELGDLFARRVDLNTPLSLSRHFRQKVLQTAMVVYERAG
jgi:predicted nucleotidyltransferase